MKRLIWVLKFLGFISNAHIAITKFVSRLIQKIMTT